MKHISPMTKYCDHCHASYATVSHRSRFCSDRCKSEHWHEEKKRAALIKVLVALYDIGEANRRILIAAVNKAVARFYKFAEWLGFTYSTKKYEWRVTAP